MIQQQSVKEKYIIFSLLLFTFISSFFGTMSSPFYPMNYWVDPNAYYTMAKSWLNGYIPYKDLFDHKGPFLYIIYAIGCLITDTSFTGIYIIQSIALFIILLYTYKISQLFLPKSYSYISSLLCSILFFSNNHFGGSAEEFIVPLQAISSYLFLKHFLNKKSSNTLRYSYIHGILIGITVLIKFNLIIFWFFPLCAIIIEYLISKELKKTFLYITYVIGGILSILIPLMIYYYCNNALSELFDCYLTFNSLYASLDFSFDNLFGRYIYIIRNRPLLLIFLFLGNIYICFFTSKLKSWVHKISIILSSYVTLLLMMAGYFGFYNLLSIYIISTLGVVFILQLLHKKINVSQSLFIYISSFITIIGLNIIVKYKMIQEANDSSYLQEFSDIILNSNNSSFMNIGLDGGFYLTTNSLPNFYYYYNPNISYDKYPLIIDSQRKFINENKPTFLIIQYGFEGAYYSFFSEYIKNDYSLVKEGYSFETKGYKFLLFKRNSEN